MMSETTRGRVCRRTFLQRTGALAAAPYFVPSAVLGSQGSTPPSDRIHLGFIGVGMMGRGHLHAFLQHGNAQVVAACDVDTWRREYAKRVTEETYAVNRPGGSYRGCEIYSDLRELLARDDIDAVVIATGDRWHALATTMAARAGKDIYCEKPVSLTIQEARAMSDTAHRYGRVAQVGLQQRSTPEFIKACNLVRSGRIGTVRYVYVGFPGTNTEVSLPAEPVPEGLDWDLWLGPAPWRPFNKRFHIYGQPPRVVPWDFCRDFGGGNLTSNTVHAFDVVQWGLGADSSGPLEIIPPETGEVPSLTYKYQGDVTVQVTWQLDPAKHFIPAGWDVKTRLQNFGALFVGDDGWIHVGRQGFLEGFPAGILESGPGETDPFQPVGNHHQNWLDCIRSRETPACDIETGCRSTMVAHLGCIAHWTDRKLQWDPVQEEFLGDEVANRLRSRPMREPWRL